MFMWFWTIFWLGAPVLFLRPHSTCNQHANSFFPWSAKHWNKLPGNIVNMIMTFLSLRFITLLLLKQGEWFCSWAIVVWSKIKHKQWWWHCELSHFYKLDVLYHYSTYIFKGDLKWPLKKITRLYIQNVYIGSGNEMNNLKKFLKVMNTKGDS